MRELRQRALLGMDARCLLMAVSFGLSENFTQGPTGKFCLPCTPASVTRVSYLGSSEETVLLRWLP